MISRRLAVLVAAGLSEIFPGYCVQVIPWGDGYRYEAVAQDMSRSPAVLITDDAGKLLRTLQKMPRLKTSGAGALKRKQETDRSKE